MNQAVAQAQQSINLTGGVDHPVAVAHANAATPAPQGDNVVSLLQVLNTLLARPDLDLERAERLVKLANEMRAEQARLAFAEDLASFTSLGIVVPKTKHVKQKARDGGPGPDYWQTEFHVVSKLLKPALGKFGFGVRFGPVFTRASDGGVPWCEVTCYLTHRLGHTETVTLGGPPDSSGSKNPLQEMKSSSTFLMRTALLAITGTAEEGADNDGRGARGYDDDRAQEQSGEGQQNAARVGLVETGQQKAELGMMALTTWWGRLTSGQRTDLSPEFGVWKKKAAQVDATRGKQ